MVIRNTTPKLSSSAVLCVDSCTNTVCHTTRRPPLVLNTTDTSDTGLMEHNTKSKFSACDSGALLLPPTLNSGRAVTGLATDILRKENKQRCIQAQLQQQNDIEWWKTHHGEFELPPPLTPVPTHRNNMCPARLALHHPAAKLLTEYATLGCPTQTGQCWSLDQIQAAIERGPHASALHPAAVQQLHLEIEEKVQKGQARVVTWDSIKHNHPPELKISPLAMIPHKSRQVRAILDLSFPVKLQNGTVVPSVNDTSTKGAPRGAISQIGYSLQRVIHAFATAAPDAQIFMAKWDIKDGFWRLDCAAGQEWNFCYVRPSLNNSDPIQLVVPTSLQMGWIESPPYFCCASETARDVAEQYIQLPLGSVPTHKFTPLTMTHTDTQQLRDTAESTDPLKFLLEVYMDDYIGLAIPTSLTHLRHFSNAVMHGIHDVFPADEDASNDPISKKKLDKGDGSWAVIKDILGLTFDGLAKTVWLEDKKRDAILTVLTGWLRAGKDKRFGIAFSDFESLVAKIRHAFMTIPAGRGLMSPFNQILRAKPNRIFLHRNTKLRTALAECRTFLRESVSTPTQCSSLITAWPDYVGVTDASSFGAGGIIIGENKATPLTVFRVQWPDDITAAVVSDSNPNGTLTNNNLEMAGLLLLWLAIEGTCPGLAGSHVALFSDNSPTVSWVARLAARKSKIAMQLLRILALRLQVQRTSPLTPLHIRGIDNAMTDIPSRSFGSEPKWFCKSDSDLLTLFDLHFPPPPQASWNVYQLSPDICTKVILVLRMQATTTDEWRRLPRNGTYIGDIGPPTSHLWDWTLSYRKPHIATKSEHSLDSPDESEQVTTVEAAKSQLRQSLLLSQPLERRSPWTQASIPPKCMEHKTS